MIHDSYHWRKRVGQRENKRTERKKGKQTGETALSGTKWNNVRPKTQLCIIHQACLDMMV